MPCSPDLSPSSRIFVEINPHQMAPTVGSLGAGFMDAGFFIFIMEQLDG
jgi:hypothetical protein